MRTIKFRAWNGRKMIMPEESAYYQHYISMCGNIVQKSSEGMDCFGGGWLLVRNNNECSLGARRREDLEIVGNIYQNPELLENKA